MGTHPWMIPGDNINCTLIEGLSKTDYLSWHKTFSLNYPRGYSGVQTQQSTIVWPLMITIKRTISRGKVRGKLGFPTSPKRPPILMRYSTLGGSNNHWIIPITGRLLSATDAVGCYQLNPLASTLWWPQHQHWVGPQAGRTAISAWRLMAFCSSSIFFRLHSRPRWSTIQCASMEQTGWLHLQQFPTDFRKHVWIVSSTNWLDGDFLHSTIIMIHPAEFHRILYWFMLFQQHPASIYTAEQLTFRETIQDNPPTGVYSPCTSSRQQSSRSRLISWINYMQTTWWVNSFFLHTQNVSTFSKYQVAAICSTDYISNRRECA